jgi:hypothetical protein
LDGKSNGKSDGTVFAIAVDKNAPSSRTYLANTAHDAVVGKAKNRSPLHLLTRFRTRPHDMFRFEKFPKLKKCQLAGVFRRFHLEMTANNRVSNSNPLNAAFRPGGDPWIGRF